jgi:hypothetical protein
MQIIVIIMLPVYFRRRHPYTPHGEQRTQDCWFPIARNELRGNCRTPKDRTGQNFEIPADFCHIRPNPRSKANGSPAETDRRGPGDFQWPAWDQRKGCLGTLCSIDSDTQGMEWGGPSNYATPSATWCEIDSDRSAPARPRGKSNKKDWNAVLSNRLGDLRGDAENDLEMRR